MISSTALHAAENPQRVFLRPLFDGAAGHFEILAPQCPHYIHHREFVAAHLERIEFDVDLPRLAADQFDLAHAFRRFQPAAQHFVAILRDVPQWRRCRNRHGNYRRGVGIHLFDRRLIGILRQIGQDAVHPVADFLCRHIDVLFQHERDIDQRNPLRRDRPQFVDAADGVDFRFDLLSDVRFRSPRARNRSTAWSR